MGLNGKPYSLKNEQKLNKNTADEFQSLQMELCPSKTLICVTNAYPCIMSSFKTNDFVSTQEMKTWVLFSFSDTNFALSWSTSLPLPPPHLISVHLAHPSSRHIFLRLRNNVSLASSISFLKLYSELPKGHLHLRWIVKIMKPRLYLIYSSMLNNHKYISLLTETFIIIKFIHSIFSFKKVSAVCSELY